MFGRKIVTALDIGTNSIKTLITQETTQGDLEVLVQSVTPSTGLRKGVVDDISEASESIKRAVEEAQRVCDRRLKSAAVNIEGSHLYVTSSHGLVSVSRADGKVSEQDVERVLQEAQAVNLPSNHEVLDVFPIEFIVDSQKGIKEPVGLTGIRLEAKVLLLCAFSPCIRKLTQAVLEAGLQIEDIIPSALAAAKVVLTKQQRELGVAVLDIGAETSQLAVLEEGHLIHFAVLPIGSANITNDIAIGLRTDIPTAEMIKKEHGTCVGGRSKRGRKGVRSKKTKKIEVEDKSGSVISFPKKLLVKIIEARVCEIFDLAQKELKKITREGLLPGGIVLTGGGAKLPKIVDLAKQELKLPCRIGVPQGIIGLEKDSSFATAAGLILEITDLESGGLSFSGSFFGKLKRMLRKLIP